MGSGSSIGVLGPELTVSAVSQSLAKTDITGKGKILVALNRKDWKSTYGVFSGLSVKDTALCCGLLNNEGEAQVKEEVLSPSFSVLGTGTVSLFHPDHAALQSNETLANDKIWWLATFESKGAYLHTEHQDRASRKELFGKIFKEGLTGNMMQDMASCGYMGPFLQLERDSECKQGLYSVASIAKAKNEESAKVLFETLKLYGHDRLAAEKGAIRFVIMDVGGDMPPPLIDAVTIRWIETCATKDDFDNTALKAAIPTLLEKIDIIEFDQVAHWTHKHEVGGIRI